MDKASIFDFLDKATDVVKAAGPIATMLGIPFVEKLTQFADTAVEVGKNAVNRSLDLKEGLTSNDETYINAKIAELEAANEELNNYIITH